MGATLWSNIMGRHETNEFLPEQSLTQNTMSDIASMIWSQPTRQLSTGKGLNEAGDQTNNVRVHVTESTEQKTTAEERLQTAELKSILDPVMRENLERDRQIFRQRLGADNIEYGKTLDAVSRLLEAENGKVDQEQRILAARSILYNAAHPETISQITCGAGALEHKLYSTNPSIPAEMTASVALQGNWTGTDGKTISFPTEGLPPVSTEFPPSDGQCSYASQLFQITAVNDIGQHLNPPMIFSPGRTHVSKREVDGKPFEMRTTIGECWVLPNGEKRSFLDEGTGVFSRTGGLTSFEVSSEVYRLTGKKLGVMCNRTYDLDDTPADQAPPGIADSNLDDVRSQQAMEARLQLLKEQGNLPVIISVSSAAIRTLDGSSVQNASVPDHFVTIDDYTPAHDGQPARVMLHNQRGSSYNGWMNLTDIFKATT